MATKTRRRERIRAYLTALAAGANGGYPLEEDGLWSMGVEAFGRFVQAVNRTMFEPSGVEFPLRVIERFDTIETATDAVMAWDTVNPPD